MSFYNDASLIMYPSGYKEDKIYSLKPTDGSGDLTFTRASSATRVNAEGLIEKVRTNLLLQSNTFDTSWTLSNATVSSGATDPNGGSTAWTLSKSASQTFHLYQNTGSLTGTYTFSVYAKAGTNNEIRVDFNNSQYVQVNLENGSIVGSGGLISNVRENVGNGWWRISISANITANTLVRFGHGGGGATGSILLWSSQLENNDIATEYIPTTTAAVSVGITNNVPRIDYTGGGCGKLLLEPQRTNLVTYSEDFSQWTAENATATINNVTSPDGTQNGTKLTPTASSQRQAIKLAQSQNGDIVISCFAKKGEYDVIQITDAINASYYVNFDLDNGVVGSSSVMIGEIENYGNGWYRCVSKYNSTLAINAVRFSIAQNATDGRLVNFAGNGTDSLYIYGAQIEQGSYPSSYIPTSGATVTRLADSASKTGISSLIGQTEGTLFAEVDIIAGSSGYHTLMQIYGDDNNRIAIGQDINSTNVFMYINASGTISYELATTPAGHYKIALAYKNGDSVLYINGAAAITNARAISLSTSLSTLFLNNVNGNEIGIFKNYQSILFKTRLTNTELAALTTL